MDAAFSKRIYTADEFFEKTAESNSGFFELHEGVITALATPSISHQTIAGRLFSRLDGYILEKKGKCKAVISPATVLLDEYNAVIPDVFVGCDPDKFSALRHNGAPDLVIEIVSTNRYDDLFRKLALYSRFGVREYWIVDPKNEKTLVYFFDESDLPEIYPFDKPIPVKIFGGDLSITISELL